MKRRAQPNGSRTGRGEARDERSLDDAMRRQPKSDSKSVALVHVAAVEAAVDPLLALLGRAVGPGLGVHVDAGGLLDAVVADRRRRSEALLEVAVLEDAA